MLLCLPRQYHSEDDDYAPIDYHYVGSVAEGERRRQGEAIHREPDRATVRHRVDPNTPAEGNAQSGAAATGGARGLETARRMPRAGDPTSAASVAYPRPRDNAFAHTPTYAPEAAPTLEAEQVHPAHSRRPAARESAAAPEGRAPASPLGAQNMPVWLRAARQNNMPLYDERRAATRIPVKFG